MIHEGIMASAGSVGQSRPPRRGEAQARVKTETGDLRRPRARSASHQHVEPRRAYAPNGSCTSIRSSLPHSPSSSPGGKHWEGEAGSKNQGKNELNFLGFCDPHSHQRSFQYRLDKTLSLARVRSFLVARKSDTVEWPFEGVRRKVLQQGTNFKKSS